MFNLILLIMRSIFFLFPSRQLDILIENAVLKKENEILKWKVRRKIDSSSDFLINFILVCINYQKKQKRFLLTLKNNVFNFEQIKIPFLRN